MKKLYVTVKTFAALAIMAGVCSCGNKEAVAPEAAPAAEDQPAATINIRYIDADSVIGSYTLAQQLMGRAAARTQQTAAVARKQAARASGSCKYHKPETAEQCVSVAGIDAGRCKQPAEKERGGRALLRHPAAAPCYRR